jgi:hypothetical protein
MAGRPRAAQLPLLAIGIAMLVSGAKPASRKRRTARRRSSERLRD